MSFMVNALLGRFAEPLWETMNQSATHVEPDVIHPERFPTTIGSTRYVIVGMGRAGTSAYDYLKGHDQRPLGIDADPQIIEDHLTEGRRVIYGDSQDTNFWSALDLSHVSAILLLIPDKSRKIYATELIRESGYEGRIHAFVRFDKDISDLIAAGVDEAFQPISQAGRDIAENVISLDKQLELAPQGINNEKQ